MPNAINTVEQPKTEVRRTEPHPKGWATQPTRQNGWATQPKFKAREKSESYEPFVLLRKICFLSLIFCGAALHGQSARAIQAEFIALTLTPGGEVISVFRLDNSEQGARFSEVWHTQAIQGLSDLAVYPEFRSILTISVKDDSGIVSIYGFTDSIPAIVIGVDSNYLAIRRFTALFDNSTLAAVQFAIRKRVTSQISELANFTISTSRNSSSSELTSEQAKALDPRIGGILGVPKSLFDNVEFFRSLSDTTQTSAFGMFFLHSSLPDSTAAGFGGLGWTMEALDRSFALFASVPDSLHLTERMLLRYAKRERTWSSCHLPGNLTNLHYGGGCYFGRVLYSGENADWAGRYLGEDVVSDSAVIYDPMTNTAAAYELPESIYLTWTMTTTEFLGISGDSLFAFVGDGKQILTRKFLLKDKIVLGILGSL